jgi:hypothetical protein
MLQFPNGQHDDIVDCLAWGARLALNISLPTTRAVPTTHRSWKEKLEGSNRGSARSFMQG